MSDVNHYVQALIQYSENLRGDVLQPLNFRGGTVDNLLNDLDNLKDRIVTGSESIIKEANRPWNEAKVNNVDLDALTEEYKS